MPMRSEIPRIIQAAAVLVALSAPPAGLGAGPPVAVADAARQPIVEIVRVSGTVTSPQSALLSPSVAGLVETVHVDAGDRVGTGDLVVTLDRELEQLAFERAAAEAAEASAALDDTRRRLAEAERVGPMRGIAESEIRSLRAEVTRAEAALEAAVAARRQQEAVVRRHAVRAPFAGVISRRVAEAGEWVNPGDGLVELVATDDLRFDFRVPQSHFARLGTETPVAITLDAAPGAPIPGRVQAIVPIKDAGARTFLLRVIADGAAATSATPGMSAQARLSIDAGRTGVVVPRDALLRYPDGRTTVWVVENGSGGPLVHEQRVDVGVEFDGLVEIRSGLDADAVVVTRGNEVLREGQPVSIR